MDWIGRSGFREAVSAPEIDGSTRNVPVDCFAQLTPSLRADRRRTPNLRTLLWNQPANSRLISNRIVALGLDFFPEILVVVVARSAVLVVEREGFVLIPVAVAAYVFAAIAMVMVAVVLFGCATPSSPAWLAAGKAKAADIAAAPKRSRESINYLPLTQIVKAPAARLRSQHSAPLLL